MSTPESPGSWSRPGGSAPSEQPEPAHQPGHQPAHQPGDRGQAPDPYAATPSGSPSPPAGYPGYPGGPGGPGRPGAAPTDAMAVVGLVLGVFFWPAGLVLSIIALRRSRPRGTSRGLPLAGIIVSAVVGVISAVVATLVVFSLISATSTVRDTASRVPSYPSLPSQTPSASATPVKPLALGQSADLGDYTVTVTSVNQNASAEVAGDSEYADPPTGQYVTAAIAVTYHGDGQGTPWVDVRPEFRGTDKRVYDTSSSCVVALPDGGLDSPDLTAGGQGTFTTCFDVPASAIAGGALAVTGRDADTYPYPTATWTF